LCQVCCETSTSVSCLSSVLDLLKSIIKLAIKNIYKPHTSILHKRHQSYIPQIDFTCHKTTKYITNLPHVPQIDLKYHKPTSSTTNRPQVPQTDLTYHKSTSGTTNWPHVPQIDLTTTNRPHVPQIDLTYHKWIYIYRSIFDFINKIIKYL